MMHITEIHSIRQTLDFLDEESHVFFDIDNTLLTSVHDFGGERWEHFMIQHFIEEGATEEDASERASHIWKAVQIISDIQIVEPDAVEVIEHLHQKGHPVFAITARSPEFYKVTEEQLSRLNLKFCQTKMNDSFAPAGYVSGVFYCGKVSKGEVLKAYAKLHQCSRILLIDDLQRHLDSAAQHLEIPFTGLRYAHLDDRKMRYIPDAITKMIIKVFNHPEACSFLKKGLI